LGRSCHTKCKGFLFFYGKTNDNHQLGTGNFVHHRLETAFKKVEIVVDRIPYTIMRRNWCNVIFFHLNGTSDEKSNDLIIDFMRN